MIDFPKDLKPEKYLGRASEELLYIDKSGWKSQKRQNEYTQRPNGRNDWQIIYISDGYGYFQYDTGLKKIGPNALVIYKPHEPQLYTYKPEGCPIANYIHFSGTMAADLMKKFGLDDKPFYIISSKYDDEIITKFLKFHTMLQLSQNEDYLCWGAFIDILSTFSKCIYKADERELPKYEQYFSVISNAIELMSSDNSSDFKVEYYAKRANMSVSHFAHIFKETTGFSPIQYRNRLRINNAKSLLLKTSLTVEEIAYEVGYSSVALFSKQFKAATKFSPSIYRKNHLK